jgi:hypothetical protein
LCGGQRAGQRGAEHRERELVPFFLKISDLMPGDHYLENAAVHLPVAELPRALFFHAQVDDVQPVAEVVEHEARLAPVAADGA